MTHWYRELQNKLNEGESPWQPVAGLQNQVDAVIEDQEWMPSPVVEDEEDEPAREDDRAERYDDFVEGLAELSRKYGVAVAGKVWVPEDKSKLANCRYHKGDEDNDLDFAI